MSPTVSPNLTTLSNPPQGIGSLSAMDELRATDSSRQGSLAQVQSSALRELDRIINRLMILGVQFPFLAEQIEGMLSLGGDLKVTLVETLAPQIQAESQPQGIAGGMMGGGMSSMMSSPPQGASY